MVKLNLRLINIVVIFSILFGSFTVNAQSNVERQFFGLIINPPIIEYTARPGDVIKGSFTVTNDYQTIPNLVLYPIVNDFESDSDNPGSPKWVMYENSNAPRVDSSLQDWITVKEKKLEYSRTGEKKTVDFEIVVPNEPLAGTHQAGIIMSETEPTGQLSNAVGIVSRIASLIFVTVDGEGTNKITKSLNLERMYLTDIDGKEQFMNIFEYLPTNINFEVSNKGNSNIAPVGDVFLNPTPDKESTSIVKINEDGKRLLRNSNRVFSGQWNDAFLEVKKDNEGKYYINVNWGKPFRLGRYVLQGKISYLDVEGKAVTRESNLVMWIIPWKIILVIVAIIIGLIIIKKIFKRRELVVKRSKNGNYDEKYTKYIDS